MKPRTAVRYILNSRSTILRLLRHSASVRTYVYGSFANGVVFLVGGGGLDVLRDKRQGVFLSGAGAFGALAG
jgi:hypothetical protein